ncbi:MAG: hypothetical protein AAGB34_02675 [Planctomycetota bacterium]
MDKTGEQRSVFKTFGVIRSHHAMGWVFVSGIIVFGVVFWQAWEFDFVEPAKKGVKLALWLPFMICAVLWYIGKYPAQRRRGLVCARCNAPTAIMMSEGAACVRCRHVHSEQDCKHLQLIAREMRERSVPVFAEFFPLGIRRIRTLWLLLAQYYVGVLFLFGTIGTYVDIFLQDFDFQDFLALPVTIGIYAILILLFLAHRRVDLHAKEFHGEVCAECGYNIVHVEEGVRCSECGHVQTKKDMKWLRKRKVPRKKQVKAGEAFQ